MTANGTKRTIHVRFRRQSGHQSALLNHNQSHPKKNGPPNVSGSFAYRHDHLDCLALRPSAGSVSYEMATHRLSQPQCHLT
jgi:hypothetical protein